MNRPARPRARTNRGRRSVAVFAVGALVGSVPFWVAGAHGARLPPPFDALPVTALVSLVPGVTAFAVAAWDGTARALLSRLRPSRLRLWPLLTAASVMTVPILMDALLRDPEWAPPGLANAAVVAVVYVVAALGEEIGWTAFALPRLLGSTGSLGATIALSSGYWMLWHLIPYLQTGQDAGWVAALCVQVVLLRAAIVGVSVRWADFCWLAVITHTAGNLAWTLMPPDSRPWVVNAFLAPIAAACVAGAAVRRPKPRPGP